MKKQLALMASLTLVAGVGFTGTVCAETETIDFETIDVGTLASDIGHPLVTIAGDSMEVVEEALGDDSILSYNSNVYGTNAAGGENWLPGDDNWRSLGNLSTNRNPDGQNLMITFSSGIIVSSFSIEMFDYGDWFPIGGSNPREAMLTAYDINDGPLDSDPLSITGPDSNNDVSVAESTTLSVSGADIAYVELTFADVDPGVTFDNLNFEYEPLAEYDLCAGQTMDVGHMQVWNDDTNLYVTYITEPGVCMTETHLHVAGSPTDIPQTKKGNPIPGQFDYTMEHNCVTEYPYTIPLENLDYVAELSIAAHAVVQMPSSSSTNGACAEGVFDYTQGTLYNGGVVGPDRSDPTKALGAPDSLRPLINFYSLGFDNPDTGEVEGVLSLSFPTFITGELTVYETTYGLYPQELADVFVSRDGMDWTLLGTADNSGTEAEYHPSTFSLDGCFQYVKIVDMSDRDLFDNYPTTAQAFDVDAACATNTCNEETAWGGCFETGFGFEGKNWATYFTYTVQ